MATRRRLPTTVAPTANSRVSTVFSRRRGGPAPTAQPIQIVPTPDSDAGLFHDLISRARSDSRLHRTGDYLHVSSLLYECQRKVALVERSNTPRRMQTLSLMEALTYAQGEAIHDLLKMRSILSRPDRVWGKWKCLCGQCTVEEPCTYDQVDTEVICEACGTTTDRYVEVSMRNDDIMVVGNPDLISYFHEFDAYHVSELKSIAHAQWEELARPKPEHVLQVLFYWWLMREAGYRLLDTVTIVYATKGFTFRGSPLKEYNIHVPTSLTRINDYIDSARERKEARAGGVLPVRTCVNENASEAKKCEVCSLCFSTTGNEVGGQEIDVEGFFAGAPARETQPVARRATRTRR